MTRSVFSLASLLSVLALAACAQPAFAAGVTGQVNVSVSGQLAGSSDLGSPVFDFRQSPAFSIAAGTGVGKADRMFADTRTIAASSSENLDLAGALTDPFGGALTCVKVKAIYIKAAAANANAVQVGGAASNAFTGPFADATDILSIPPGGLLTLVHPGAGWTVTAATGDLLKVANGGAGTGVTYDVIVLCASA